MKVLIPLVSGKELNEEFLDKAVKKASEVFLLMVIDTEDKNSLKASDISSSTHFLEEVKKAIGKKRKKCEDLTEWGKTKTKIKNTAIINKIDKIVLLKQKNLYFEELLKELRKENEIKNKIEIIEIRLEEKETEETKEEQSTEEKEEKEPNQKKQIKSIADKILREGFKGIDSIKKIRFKKEEE